jgi:hypothetical protein
MDHSFVFILVSTPMLVKPRLKPELGKPEIDEQ